MLNLCCCKQTLRSMEWLARGVRGSLNRGANATLGVVRAFAAEHQS